MSPLRLGVIFGLPYARLCITVALPRFGSSLALLGRPPPIRPAGNVPAGRTSFEWYPSAAFSVLGLCRADHDCGMLRSVDSETTQFHCACLILLLGRVMRLAGRYRTWYRARHHRAGGGPIVPCDVTLTSGGVQDYR